MTAASGRRRLRRLAAGQAGPRPAVALGIVALLTAFVAVAAPAELAAADNGALNRVVAGIPVSERSVVVTSQWRAYATDTSTITTVQRAVSGLAAFGARIRPPLAAVAGQSWASVTSPTQPLLSPLPRLNAPTSIETAYRSDLTAHARLVAGALPVTATSGPPAVRRARTSSVTFQVAMTTATATRFGLRVGSLLNLGSPQGGDPVIKLRVTGIVRPLATSSGFWQYDPVLRAPQLQRVGAGQIWLGGFLVGGGELGRLQSAQSGIAFGGASFFPLNLRGLTAARLPALLRGIAALDTSSAPRLAGSGPAAASNSQNSFPPAASSDLPVAFGAYQQDRQAGDAVGSLLFTGLVAVGLILVLVCAGLTCGAHRPELDLIRARGASTAQAAARVLARSSLATVPALAAGTALALLTVPADGGAASVILGGATAAVTVASPALLAVWLYRRDRSAAASRADLTVARRSPRRTVAEIAFLVAAAGSLAALRQRGAATGADTLVSLSPVLVAGAAALVAARAYPLAVRPLLAVGAARPGPVSFIGLARAARSRLGTILPALALVLALSLAAFGGMIGHSVSAGQASAAWRQVGADAIIEAGGDGVISPAAQHAVGAIPGVRHVAAVYTAAAHSAFGIAVSTGRTSVRAAGLVIADPASYSALARDTPWGHFPTALLAARTGPGQPVPALASAGLGPLPRSAKGVLTLSGTQLRVAFVGVIGDTPARPTGGAFVVLPSWALGRLPAIPGPDALLVTGQGASVSALRAATKSHVPGGQIAFRALVRRQLADSPVQHADVRLFGLGIAAAVLFGAMALLLALAASARSRGQLILRLAALGMTRRQSRALALTDTLPLLSVAVGGMILAGFALAAVTGPAINLAVFTGSAVPVPVRPYLQAMLIPAAVVLALAGAIIAAERVVQARQAVGAELRQEEAG